MNSLWEFLFCPFHGMVPRLVPFLPVAWWKVWQWYYRKGVQQK